jgi:putative DNA primase/helicase
MAAGGNHSAKREAREFLRERLEAGAVSSDELVEEAKQEGIAEKTLRRAKKELGVKSRKGSFDSAWTWELPSQGGLERKMAILGEKP